ncbi:hypothetical protein O3V59_17805, partial [Brevibacillus thermoruber]
MKLGRLVEREEYVYEQSMNNRHLFDEASIIQSFIAVNADFILTHHRRFRIDPPGDFLLVR